MSEPIDDSDTVDEPAGGQVQVPETFMRWAHQGGAREAPSNTIGAMEAAVATGGANALEYDVHCSLDGHVVVIHDRRLGRTTSGRGFVALHRLARLRTLDAAYWWVPGHIDCHNCAPERYTLRGRAPSDTAWRIPTASEVLDRFPDVPMTVEIKDPRAARRFLELVAARRRSDICVVSFWDPIIWYVRWWLRRHPDVQVDVAAGTGYLIWFWFRVRRNRPPRTTPFARLQIPVEKFGMTFATDEFVVAAHAAGAAVDVWTVDDRGTMRRLAAMGVDGIMTDKPSALAAAVGGPG